MGVASSCRTPPTDGNFRVYRGRRDLIDHILVSATLARARCITEVTNAHRDEPGSDRRLVHAEFDD